jgi:hypothetical protein
MDVIGTAPPGAVGIMLYRFVDDDGVFSGTEPGPAAKTLGQERGVLSGLAASVVADEAEIRIAMVRFDEDYRRGRYPYGVPVPASLRSAISNSLVDREEISRGHRSHTV